LRWQSSIGWKPNNVSPRVAYRLCDLHFIPRGAGPEEEIAMSEKYEIQYTETGPVQVPREANAPGLLVAGQTAASAPAHAYPVPYRAPFRLPAIANTAVTILAAGVLFFGAERFAPHAYKPSTLLGSYEATVNEQLKAAELSEQARFTAYEASVKLAVETQAKQNEMLLTGLIENYRAIYDRGKLMAETAMRMQERYLSARIEQQSQLQSGNMQVVTLSTIVGRLMNGMMAPGSGDGALRYAETISNEIERSLERAAVEGARFKLQDWDLNLVPPDVIKSEIMNLPVVRIPPPPPLSRHFGNVQPPTGDAAPQIWQERAP
jgi:hypothetical protein